MILAGKSLNLCKITIISRFKYFMTVCLKIRADNLSNAKPAVQQRHPGD